MAIDITDERFDGMMVADGLDEAIIGVASRCGMSDVLAYDVGKVLSILMERDGMSYDEAREFFDFNIGGSYVGDTTPIWIEPIDQED